MTERIESGSPLVPALVAAGDLLVFIFFASEGLTTHNLSMGASPILTVLGVAAPFALPWFAAAFLMGVYRQDTNDHLIQMLVRAALAWIVAGVTGLLIRSTLLGRPFIMTFAEVAMGVNAALLLGWRIVFALARTGLRAARAAGRS